MSLITNVMDHSLDVGYAEAAARKKSAGEGGLPKTLRAKLGLAGGLVLAALVVTLGAAQAQGAAPVVAKEHQELIDRIDSETANADKLEHTVDTLRDDVSARQRAALKSSGGSGQADLVGVLSGATEVHGPGVKLVVNDAKEASSGGDGTNPRETSGFSDSGRVRDRDMQRVVNGLWASGAEAVSINGQRLTALSAIRAAGDAILVDNRPLVPPYTVLSIGNGAQLSSAFQAGVGGRYLKLLQDNYGIRADISVQGSVDVPAAAGVTLRYASPAGAGTGGATP